MTRKGETKAVDIVGHPGETAMSEMTHADSRPTMITNPAPVLLDTPAPDDNCEGGDPSPASWLAVWEVIRSVTSSLQIEEILREILEGMRRILGLEKVALGLVNAERGREEIKLGIGWRPQDVAGVVWPVSESESIWRNFVERPEPLLIDPGRYQNLPAGILELFDGPFWKVPLTNKGEVVGSIMGSSGSRPLQRSQVPFLQVLAEAAAIAIENARLYYDVLRSKEALQQAQARLIETERLAAIGQLAISINHEINNPLCTINMSTQLLRGELARRAPDLLERVEVIEKAAERIADVTRRVAEIKRAKTKEYLNNKEMLDLS